MIIALAAAILAGVIGWRRAGRRGGNRADRIQYALAHAFPAFLLAMVLMTVLGRFGWLG